MEGRFEFDRPLWVGGKEGRLFASCGRRDDYLELAFPGDTNRAAELYHRLVSGTVAPEGTELDFRFPDQSSGMVCVLVVYSGDCEQIALPRTERIQSLLGILAESDPSLDFGDLLPGRSASAGKPAASRSQGILAGPEEFALSGNPIPAGGDIIDLAHASAPAQVAPELSSAEWHPECSAPPMDNAACPNVLNRARELAEKGQTHKALRLLDEALRTGRADGELAELRECLIRLDRRERNCKRDPKSPQAQLELGFSYLTLLRDSEAISAFRRAIALKPGLYLAHLLLGMALHHSEQKDAATRAYMQAATLAPHEKVPQELLEALNRGDAPPRPVEGPMSPRPKDSTAAGFAVGAASRRVALPPVSGAWQSGSVKA